MTRPHSRRAPAPEREWKIVVGIGTALAVLVAVVAWLAWPDSTEATPRPTATAAANSTAATTSPTPTPEPEPESLSGELSLSTCGLINTNPTPAGVWVAASALETGPDALPVEAAWAAVSTFTALDCPQHDALVAATIAAAS